MTPVLVYVDPCRRGAGYGIHLAIAGGQQCRDVLRSTYNATRRGWRLHTKVLVEPVSIDGEHFAVHLVAVLRKQNMALRAKRRVVSVGYVVVKKYKSEGLRETVERAR